MFFRPSDDRVNGACAREWFSVPNRISCAKNRWGIFAHRMRNIEVDRRRATRVSPHLRTVLSHPLGETRAISPHPHATTANQQTTCSNQVGQNSPSFAPREKRKKFSGAKFRSPPLTG